MSPTSVNERIGLVLVAAAAVGYLGWAGYDVATAEPGQSISLDDGGPGTTQLLDAWGVQTSSSVQTSSNKQTVQVVHYRCDITEEVRIQSVLSAQGGAAYTALSVVNTEASSRYGAEPILTCDGQDRSARLLLLANENNVSSVSARGPLHLLVKVAPIGQVTAIGATSTFRFTVPPYAPFEGTPSVRSTPSAQGTPAIEEPIAVHPADRVRCADLDEPLRSNPRTACQR